jgi:hypothetical protein
MFGAPAGSDDDLSQRSPLTLDNPRWSPCLLRWANRGFDLDPHSVQVGQQGAVLLPARSVSSRLLVQKLGKEIAATV